MKSRKFVVWALIIAMCMMLMPVTAMAATKVTRISMGRSSITLKVGEKYRLSYSLSPSKATTSDLRFTSSSSRVSVSSTGWLTAKSVGTATITVKARSGSASSSVRVTVVSKTVPTKPPVVTQPPQKIASVSDIISIINSERRRYNFSALSSSSSANSSADSLARQFINNPGMNSDENEILFYANSGDSARSVAEALIRAAGSTILKSNYTSIGLDCYTDSRGRQYWAAVLLPKSAAPSTAPPTKAPTPTPTVAPTPTPAPKTDTQALESKLLNAINSKRSSSISRSSSLNTLARKRAQDLATRFDHTRPNGVFVTDYLANQGFNKTGADECIAKTAKGSTIADVMDAWNGNAYGNALKDLDPSGAARPHTKVGIGCYEAPDGTLYWSVLMVN